MEKLAGWLPKPVRPFPDSEQIVREGMEALQPRKSEHGQGPALSPAFYRKPKIEDVI